MGDIIQLLPDHVANQIAAGEVVQRPSSVVKELVENSVDAKATKIELIVKDSGKTLIQIIDNGFGMSVTDLRMAFERHATSKIRKTTDLFSIQTKGFRGEALASIAAVAQVEAISKREQDEMATEIRIEGNEIKAQKPIVAKTGSSIAIKHLFFNVPARRNFLKSNHIEFRHIQEEFLRIALAHPNIFFRLSHNGSDLFLLRPNVLRQRIIQIFGKKLQDVLIPINEETEVVKIAGFVGKPNSAKKSRGEQYFFINNRFIKNGYLHKAILDGFHGLLPQQYHPAYFLFFTINPAKIDINIHPTKTEVKFEDDHSIYAILRSATKHALGQYNVAPSLDFEQSPDWAFINHPPKGKTIIEPKIRIDTSFNPFESKKNTLEQKRANLEIYQEISLEKSVEQETFFEKTEAISNKCFQWRNQYIVYENDSDIYIIDQHRAHSTILYDKMVKAKSRNILSQQLLFPITIELTPIEATQLKTAENQLIEHGFDIVFQESLVEIKSVPTDLNTENLEMFFSDFLTELEYNNPKEKTYSLEKTLSKSSAIKKGEELQKEQALHLAQELFQLETPNISPFGKMVFVKMDLNEVIKTLK